MSADKPLLELKVQSLETQERIVDISNVSCYIFLNTQPSYVLEVDDPNNKFSVPINSPKSIIQLIFKKNDQKDPIGCISFLMEAFLKLHNETVSQW